MKNFEQIVLSKAVWTLRYRILVLSIFVLGISCSENKENVSPKTVAAAPPTGFRSEYAQVNGVKIHYVIGGTGQPLVLLHGFGQNWYMWNRILPQLGERYTVIVPDLRGIGESDKPETGYDKVTLARDIHELVRTLNFNSIRLVGHDIGLMVGYAYAATYPQEVEKLVLMDAIIPGVEPEWTSITTTNWWFGFQAKPNTYKSVEGNEREYLTDFWPAVQYRQSSFTSDEVNEFVRAYSVPGAMRGSFAWFQFQKDVTDNQRFFGQKLTMPVLAMGGQYFSAGFLPAHVGQVASNVTAAPIPEAAHWLVQENPEAVLAALLAFL